MRNDRSHLVEWLEFHRLMGVQHFFIYNTSPRKKQHLLREALSDYIADGNVTIVSWPYSNCVEGMGSGRWVQWMHDGASIFFQPPRTIAQTAALASCYSRYKYSTHWMAHVDDDEFLSFNFGKSFWGRRMTSLYDLVNTVSTKRPRTMALYFKPLKIIDCSASFQFRLGGRVSNVLPRFGRWQVARAGPEWEGKLIMRTDAVGMFSTHYVTLVEKGPWDSGPYILSMDDAAILHYKLAPETSGSIYGAYLPFKVGEVPRDCTTYSPASNRNETFVRRRLTSFIIPSLEREYSRRMGLTSSTLI